MVTVILAEKETQAAAYAECLGSAGKKGKVHIAREKKKSQGTNRVEITGIVMILLGFFVCLSLGGYGMGIVGKNPKDRQKYGRSF